MSTISEAAQALIDALATVEDLRVISDGTSALDPPCALLGPPQIDWTTYGRGPSQATFTVLLAVPANDRATESLWQLVETVADAIQSTVNAVVRSAFPVSVTVSQGADLPAYQLQTEVSL